MQGTHLSNYLKHQNFESKAHNLYVCRLHVALVAFYQKPTYFWKSMKEANKKKKKEKYIY